MSLSIATLEVLRSLVVFTCGVFISIIAAQIFRIKFTMSVLLYGWHTTFCVIYLWYVLTYGGDALGYFYSASRNDLSLGVGTEGVTFLVWALRHWFSLSLLGCSLFFNILGFIGLLAFYGSLKLITADKSLVWRQLAIVVVLLPSISFWSAGIGKDSLSFMSAGLSLWAVIGKRPRIGLFIFSTLVMFFVRPHVAAVMVAAWIIAVACSYRSSIVRRASILVLAFVGAAAIFPFALQYSGLGVSVDKQVLFEYVVMRQSFNTEGGGGIDLSSMSTTMQLFTYLFRPLVFEANTAFELAAAVENLFLMVLSLIAVWCLIANKFLLAGGGRVYMGVYVTLTWVMLATTTANLGIALRQKWMFVPFLIYMFFSVVGGGRKHENSSARSVRKKI